MKRRSSRLLISCILLLALAVAVLAWLNRGQGQLVGGQLEIRVQGESVALLLPEAVYALPAREVYKEIVSGSQENQAGVFRGLYLHTLLDAAAPGWQQGASQVVCRAEDNYISSFSVDEVLSGGLFVAYALDGELLAARADGGYGPLRLVALDDAFGNRSTYWLCRVEVE